MKQSVRLTVALCFALLSPRVADACHGCVGKIEWVEYGLHIGRGVDYSMISLSINASAPAGFSFNTGVATWLNQAGASVVNTASQQGFTLIDENAPITLPVYEPEGFPRGFFLGDLLPPVFGDIPSLNQYVTVLYQVAGTPGVQVGGFVIPAIPEPSSIVLAGLACAALPSFVRRPRPPRI